MSDRRTVLFVSDGTGITVEMLGHSLLTQFEGLDVDEVTIPFIDSLEQSRSKLSMHFDGARYDAISQRVRLVIPKKHFCLLRVSVSPWLVITERP